MAARPVRRRHRRRRHVGRRSTDAAAVKAISAKNRRTTLNGRGHRSRTPACAVPARPLADAKFAVTNWAIPCAASGGGMGDRRPLAIGRLRLAAASALLVAAASPALADPNCWTDVTPKECPNGGWHVLQFKNGCGGGEKTINVCAQVDVGNVDRGRHPFRQLRQWRRDRRIPSRPLRKRRHQLQLALRRQRAGLSDAIAQAVGQREISERASSVALAGFSPMRRMA